MKRLLAFAIFLAITYTLACQAQVTVGGGSMQATAPANITFHITVIPGVGRTDLLTVVLPSVPPQAGPNTCTAGNLPACQNFTGAGTCFNDPNFGTRVCRITDINTGAPGFKYEALTAGHGGSSDESEWNCTSPPTRLTVDDTNGRIYPLIFTDNNGNMSATRMYTSDPAWSAQNGFYLQGLLSWAHNCTTPNYIYNVTSTGKIIHYDLSGNTTNAPASVQDFDFTSCLNTAAGGTFGTITWNTNGGSDQFDNDFVVAFSNSGGQGGVGSVYVAVWRRGSGCRVLNVATNVITGDWGPTGTATNPVCTSSTLHNVKLFKVGGASGALLIVPTGCNSGFPYVWFYPSMTIAAVCTFQCGGHFTEGLTTYINAPGGGLPHLWDARSYTNPGSPTGLTPSLPAGGYVHPNDGHWGWEQKNDSTQFFGASTSFGNPIVNAWQYEVLGISPVAPGNPTRYANTYSVGASPFFSTANAIGGISQDGNYYAWSSDWLQTLGCTTGNGAPPAPTTCIASGPAWIANTAYAANKIITPGIVSGQPNGSQNNSGKFSFQALANCTSGSSVPGTWNQTVGGTTTDGTCTWSNIGVGNTRGDVFVVKLKA